MLCAVCAITLCVISEPFKEAIYCELRRSEVLSCVLELVRLLLPALSASSRRSAPIGAQRRVAEALATLHSAQKTFTSTDTLMVRTLAGDRCERDWSRGLC